MYFHRKFNVPGRPDLSQTGPIGEVTTAQIDPCICIDI